MNTIPPAPPANYQFRFTNAFQLVLDMHKVGYSRSDILWVLDTIDLLEPLRKALRDSDEAAK